MSGRRMHIKNEIHLITNRCFQQRLLMLPCDEVNFIIGYWFARSLVKFGAGLDIFTFVFLSNHFHLIVRDTAGTLSAFLGYFQANVAKALNERMGRNGAFWQGHYDDQVVEGEDTFWDKYIYVTGNAVKAGLVDASDDWVGWSSLDKALHGGTFRFTALNRSRYNKACQHRKKKPDPKQFEETYEFTLTPPLGLEKQTVEERADHLRPLLRKQEAIWKEQREGKPPLGIDAVLNQHPTDRPRNPARSPKKRFACKDERRLKERLAEYRAFIGAYREIYEQFKIAAKKRKRFHCEWPIGSYPPGARYPIAV
jgi:REP element-mobilizing transposase RayT